MGMREAAGRLVDGLAGVGSRRDADNGSSSICNPSSAPPKPIPSTISSSSSPNCLAIGLDAPPGRSAIALML